MFVIYSLRLLSSAKVSASPESQRAPVDVLLHHKAKIRLEQKKKNSIDSAKCNLKPVFTLEDTKNSKS